MVKVFPKNEEKVEINVAVENDPLEKQASQDEEQGIAALLKKTRSEEADLLEQKKMLASLKENLLSKAKEEIESRKGNIESLKSEIAELKASCEAINKSLSSSIASQ